MSMVLIVLSLPLLISPMIVRPARISPAIGQLIAAFVGLAVLDQGAGTLAPGELRALVLQSSRDAWFVGATVGAMLAAIVVPARTNPRQLLPVLPLSVALLACAFGAWLPLLVGVVIGSIPVLIGRRFHAVSDRVFDGHSTRLDLGALALAGLACAALFYGPLAVAVVLLLMLAWREWFLAHRRGVGAVPLAPLVATIALACWAWQVMTISGSWTITIAQLSFDAPFTDEAAIALGLMLIVGAFALAVPWPPAAAPGLLLRLPLVVLLVHGVLGGALAVGVLHWQPITTAVLLVVAGAALTRGRVNAAAMALSLLAATRPGSIALVVAVLVALAPTVRAWFDPDRGMRLAGGVLLAGVTAVVVTDQVVYALVLLTVLLVVTNRRPARIAPSTMAPHV